MNNITWRSGRVLGAWLFLSSTIASGNTTAWESHVSSDVLAIYTSGSRLKSPTSANVPPLSTPNGARFDANGRLEVDVHYECSNDKVVAELKSTGLIVGTSIKIPKSCVVEGWIAPSAIASLASIAGVTHIKLPSYAVQRPPPGKSNQVIKSTSPFRGQTQGVSGGNTINGNAVSIMHADQYITQSSVNGTGGRLIFASKSDGRNTHYFPRVFDTACVSCGFHYRSCYP